MGNNVLNNYSVLIHTYFKNKAYESISLNYDEFITLLKNKNFDGINVTKPFKDKCLEYLDELTPLAKEIGAVNLILNKNGKLIGDNTDLQGLEYLLQKKNIDLSHKVVGILGSGGSAKTIKYLATKYHAKAIYFVSRRSNTSYITYEEINNYGIEVLFNATPIGMFPNNYEELPLDLKKLNKLETYIDLNYNPCRNLILQDMQSLNIKAYNGLDMLIEQARLSEELFFDKKIDIEKNEMIKKLIVKEKSNICLIGMPYSGKTSIGYEVARITNKEFVDIDSLIEEMEDMPISDLINSKGEAYFRNIETRIVKQISVYHNLVISAGGGSILSIKNIKYLRQNGYFCLLNRNVEDICFDESRPLTSNKRQYLEVYEKRKNLYKQYADFEVENNKSIHEVAKVIKEKYDEIINY